MTVRVSLHSLLDYERLLFYCGWLGSNLRIGHLFSFHCPLVSTPQLNTQLSYEWITELPYESTLFYNSEWTEEGPSPRIFHLLLSVFFPLLCNLPSDSLLSNGGPSSVDCITSGMCLPNRCLANVIFFTIPLVVWPVLGNREKEKKKEKATLRKVSPLVRTKSASNYEYIISCPSYLYQKNEWALTGNIQSRNIFCPTPLKM
jgi:hypothetical protein